MSLSKFGFTGCEPPPPKKRKTDEEKREVGRLYDKDKRQRTFKHSWLVEFSWLIYDPNTNKMCCRICLDSSILVVGHDSILLVRRLNANGENPVSNPTAVASNLWQV